MSVLLALWLSGLTCAAVYVFLRLIQQLADGRRDRRDRRLHMRGQSVWRM